MNARLSDITAGSENLMTFRVAIGVRRSAFRCADDGSGKGLSADFEMHIIAPVYSE